MKRLLVFAAVIQAAAWAAQAAYVLSDNLGQPIGGASFIGQGQPNYEAAQVFTTVGPATLDSVTIAGANSGGANGVMELYQISSLAPLIYAPVGTLTAPSSWPSGPGLMTWGGNDLALDAGSMYAVGLTVNGPGWIAWAWAEGNTGYGPGFSTYSAELDWSGNLYLFNIEPY